LDRDQIRTAIFTSYMMLDCPDPQYWSDSRERGKGTVSKIFENYSEKIHL